MPRLIAFSLSIILGSLASLAYAEADGPDFYAVTGVASDDVLNLRAEPSARSEKIGAIPHNARRLRSLGCQGMPTFAEWEKMTPQQRARSGKNHWCRVEFRGTTGWVAGRYLREDSGPVRGSGD